MQNQLSWLLQFPWEEDTIFYGKNTANLKGALKKVTLKTFIKRKDLDAVLLVGHGLHFSRHPHRFQWDSVE